MNSAKIKKETKFIYIRILLILISVISLWISFSLAEIKKAVITDNLVNKTKINFHFVEQENQNQTGSKQIAKVTAFSAQEYCAVPIIKQRIPDCNGNTYPESSIALNSKYGTHWNEVYIPTLNQTFRVIGTTDYKTDADIWFGADYAGAKQFGYKYLELILL